MLNCLIVAPHPQGMAASERALSTYCAMQRLFLALVQHYKLQPQVSAALARFAGEPAARSKANTPNLGHLIPLLGVAPDAAQHCWARMGMAIAAESCKRQTLWICKHNPALADSLQLPTSWGGADSELLQQSFEACRVGTRLLAFHFVFLQHVARPAGSSLEQVPDAHGSWSVPEGCSIAGRRLTYSTAMLALLKGACRVGMKSVSVGIAHRPTGLCSVKVEMLSRRAMQANNKGHQARGKHSQPHIKCGVQGIACHADHAIMPSECCEQVAYELDVLYGRPGPAMLRRMQGMIKAILDMDGWPAFWRMIGLPLPGDPGVTMTRRLWECWQGSLAAGYHRKVQAMLLVVHEMILHAIHCGVP